MPGTAQALSAIVALAAATSATIVAAHQAGDGDREQCHLLSFDPLGVNVPACTRLLASAVASRERIGTLASRAEAFAWAVTYRHGELDSADLLALAAADLDDAIDLADRAHESEMLPRLRSRREEIAIRRAEPESATSLNGDARRSIRIRVADALMARARDLAAAGRLRNAVADTGAALALSEEGAPQAPGWLMERAGFHEAAGDAAAAADDYRRVLRLAPDHAGARAALARLEPGRD